MLNSGEYAKVLSVSPVTKTVYTPREECSNQQVAVQNPTKDPNQIAGTVTGAVIGGLVGNQIGDGDGKKVATVGGVIAGGYTGKKVQEGMQERNVGQVSQRVCDTKQESSQERIGYDVTYTLDGTEKTVRMDNDPGKRIRIENGKPVTD